MRVRLLLSMAVLVGVFALTARVASADTYSISTGVAAWQFTNFTGFPGSAGAGDPVYDATILAEGSAATSITANPGWVAAPAGSSWVSALATGATQGVHGRYTYELTLTSPPLQAGFQYLLSGVMSSDNLIDSFKVNGVEQLTGNVGPTVYSFQTLWTVPSSSAVAPLISITVYNEAKYGPAGTPPLDPFGLPYDDGVNPIGGTDNPTGLLVSGTATLVPLPAAVWAGLVLLGGLGVKQVRRSRA